MKNIVAGILCLLILLAGPAGLAAGVFPPLTGRIVDQAHILEGSAAQGLNGELAQLEQTTGVQLVIVTVPDLQDQDIADYGYQLGRAWGIGQKGKDDGALLIVAPADHKTRIEVGYGLEGRLTDAATSMIINNVMLPAFRAGDYNKGITDGTHALISLLSDGETVLQPADTVPETKGLPVNLIWILLLLYLVFFRSHRRRSLLGPLVLGGMIGRSNRGGFGGGGGFRGGGGGFGGGGASGSW